MERPIKLNPRYFAGNKVIKALPQVLSYCARFLAVINLKVLKLVLKFIVKLLIQFKALLLVLALQSSLVGCSDNWNAPYKADEIASNTLFSAFSSPPKHLDPVISYNANEWSISSQILEPPLQYHFLKRPYQLEPLTLATMPSVKFFNASGEEVASGAKDLEFSEVLLQLKPGILYQEHPAFVKNSDGSLKYKNLAKSIASKIKSPFEIAEKASRELVAEDYAYAIKRMAVRQNHSPILDLMFEHIVGLADFSEQITAERAKFGADEFFDLREFSFPGVEVLDDYQLKIKLHGEYPQFLYWLSMNFFAPIPWEVLDFYAQPDLVAKNISFDTYPVGTGAYFLAENNPNQRMRLVRHQNYQPQFYPTDGLQDDMPRSLLADAGKRLPFIDQVIYTLEKESVPYWNKFLQGYYDASGVSSDSFDQAVQVSGAGDLGLAPDLVAQGIHLRTGVDPSIFYFAFNMLDEVVGGYSEQQQKLRQAISIAIDFEEFVSIFMNERGLVAQGPIPPGIFGFNENEANPITHDWNQQQNQMVRKDLAQAKTLLAEAGYPNGRNAKTGQQLKLHYDAVATGPDDRARLDWIRKQFAKLGIELVIRSTDYNRFQDKVRKGDAQLIMWGWNADYPDPENFLFLLYGANGTVATKGAGVNSANYANPEFDRLFEQIQKMENSPERMKLIQQAVDIARKDAPWVWGVNPKSLALYHAWYQNIWPNKMAMNTLKYLKIDQDLRQQKQQVWNQPVRWPLVLAGFGLLLLAVYARNFYRKTQVRKGKNA